MAGSTTFQKIPPNSNVIQGDLVEGDVDMGGGVEEFCPQGRPVLQLGVTLNIDQRRRHFVYLSDC